jgi:hypothetical protein
MYHGQQLFVMRFLRLINYYNNYNYKRYVLYFILFIYLIVYKILFPKYKNKKLIFKFILFNAYF